MGDKTLLLEEDGVYKTQSLNWRRWHWCNYTTGATAFVFGSLCYYPNLDFYFAGAFFFIVGGIGFFVADLTEWWYYRLGCAFDSSVRALWAEEVGTPAFGHASEATLVGRAQRAEVGVSFFVSVMGSLLYLTGAVCFIPSSNLLAAGCWQFILGSSLIIIAQTWKVTRSGCRSDNPKDRRFRLINYLGADHWALTVDVGAGVGGFGYFVGTILFLLDIDTDGLEQVAAASWFMAGGTAFTLSALSMFYRYFVAKGMPWEKLAVH